MSGEFDPVCKAPRGLVRPVRLDPTGERGPTRGQAQRAGWRRTTKGFFVPSSVSDAVVEQRILEQSMRLPTGGAVTGWASCRLAGAAYFDGLERDGATRQPVPLAVPASSKVRTLEGSTVRREPLAEGEVVTLQGIPTTRVVRGLFDEMRRVADAWEAVVALDMAAAAELVSIRELREYARPRSRWARSRRVEWSVGLASERSRSPGETRTRLVWVVVARLPAPLVNQPVWDLEGRLLGVADLFDPTTGVVVEYDGGTHRSAGRHARDVRREDGFRRAGAEYVKVTVADLRDHTMLADRMVTSRQRAATTRAARRWTVQPPAGWWTTETAEERLARRDWLRSQGVPA
jgi:hypothetical protein